MNPQPITLQTGEPPPPATPSPVAWSWATPAAVALVSAVALALLTRRARWGRLDPRERAFRSIASALGVRRSERESVRRTMATGLPGVAPVVGLISAHALARAAAVTASAEGRQPAPAAPRPAVDGPRPR